jgi:hypothetical protein
MDLPLWQAVGLLESLWLLTGREAPRGDLGKLSNEDVALAIDYRGDEDALIDALVSCGWIDRDPEARLAVHDWADHADDAVHMRLARRREYFVGGRAPKLTRLTAKERETAQEFYSQAHDTRTPCAQSGGLSALPVPVPVPVPVPEPEPEPVPGINTLAGADAPLVLVSPEPMENAPKRKPYGHVLKQVARSIHDRHPDAFDRRNLSAATVEKKLGTILKYRRVPAAEAEAYLRRIDRNHVAACASEGWTKDGGEFAKGLRGWLSTREELYDVEPAPPAAAREIYSPPAGLKSIDQLKAERERRRREGGFADVQSA